MKKLLFNYVMSNEMPTGLLFKPNWAIHLTPLIHVGFVQIILELKKFMMYEKQWTPIFLTSQRKSHKDVYMRIQIYALIVSNKSNIRIILRKLSPSLYFCQRDEANLNGDS